MLKHTESSATIPADTEWATTKPLSASQTNAAQAELVKLLSRQLTSRNILERTAAEHRLAKLDVSTILALMAYQRQLHKQRIVRVGALCGALVFVLPVLVVLFHTPIFFWTWWAAMLAFVSAATFTKAQQTGAMALARFDDLNAVGELVSSLEMRDEDVQNAIRPALTRLLPRLRAEDSNLLNPRQRRILLMAMEGTVHGRQFSKQHESEEETLFLMAVLKALEQVGDAAFIPVVSRWAQGRGRIDDPGLRQAARQCLIQLEQSASNSRSGKELLRASDPDRAFDPVTLVRPVASPPDDPPAELLRPTDPN